MELILGSFVEKNSISGSKLQFFLMQNVGVWRGGQKLIYDPEKNKNNSTTGEPFLEIGMTFA